MITLLTLLLPFCLLIPGFWLAKVLRIKTNNYCEVLTFSYILTLLLLFTGLYLGSIFHEFALAAYAFLFLTAIAIIHLSLSYIREPRLVHSRLTYFSQWLNRERLIFISLVVALLAIYTLFLSSRALLDSDAAQYYLPMAREIVRQNGFTYSSGYDYNILLKPIGAAVIYSWTYFASGSILSESFRLLPLVPLLVLVMLNYGIASSATKSKTVGLISTAIFILLPFNDRFISYTAFYPDMFYYPLIFSVIYFLIQFYQNRKNSMLLWSGLALGIAGLLNAQTIYVVIAFVVFIAVLELYRFKKLSLMLCCVTPFLILIPSILSDARAGSIVQIPKFTSEEWILLLFVAVLNGICFYLTLYRKILFNKETSFPSTILNFIKKICILIIPFTLISGLWYITNLVKFGTLISTSSINLLNYGWALNILNPLQIAPQIADVGHYLLYFLFMFVDPAVMGFVWLIPLLAGLLFIFRHKLGDFNILLFFEFSIAVIILAEVAVSLPSTLGYNPRDIFVLTPMLTTLSAIGLFAISNRFNSKFDNLSKLLFSLLFVAFFGFLSYVHSVLVYNVSLYYNTAIGSIMSSFVGFLRLNLAQTSFQLSYVNRAYFVGNNILVIILFSAICGIPLLFVATYNRWKPYVQRIISIKLKRRLPTRKSSVLWTLLIIVLLLSVIVLPRVELFYAEGGFQKIESNQLQQTYGSLYDLILEKDNLTGGILTYQCPDGLPYYFPLTQIIDLAVPSNLAFLKNDLLSNSTETTISKLGQLGIHYLVLS